MWQEGQEGAASDDQHTYIEGGSIDGEGDGGSGGSEVKGWITAWGGRQPVQVRCTDALQIDHNTKPTRATAAAAAACSRPIDSEWCRC